MTNEEIIKEYLPLHEVRNVKNAKIVYSSRAHHIVEFEYNKLKDNYFVKIGLDSAEDICRSTELFTNLNKAQKFINLVNKTN